MECLNTDFANGVAYFCIFPDQENSDATVK